ncbi:hypothetical protein ACYSNR_00670 [Enterococcus sp. LJL128]
MFISFGQYIGLIILTILMIVLIIYLTLTGGRKEKQAKLRAKIANRFGETSAAPSTEQNYGYPYNEPADYESVQTPEYTNQDAYYTNYPEDSYQDYPEKQNYYEPNQTTENDYQNNYYSDDYGQEDNYTDSSYENQNQPADYTEENSHSSEHYDSFANSEQYPDHSSDYYSHPENPSDNLYNQQTQYYDYNDETEERDDR